MNDFSVRGTNGLLPNTNQPVSTGLDFGAALGRTATADPTFSVLGAEDGGGNGGGDGGRIFINPRSGTSLQKAAKDAGVSVDDLLKYNPGLSARFSIPSDPAKFNVDGQVLYTSGVTVQAGDGLYQVAQRLLTEKLGRVPQPKEVHTAVAMLKMWNPQLTSVDSYDVKAGALLSVDAPELTKVSKYPEGALDGLGKAWDALTDRFVKKSPML